tara:strand:- start:1661 stop:2728 length:1068 start_codon:yes stop_codon:yes gene_type:complete
MASFVNRYVFLTPEQTTNQTNQTLTYGTDSGMVAYNSAYSASYIGGEVDDESIQHQFETMYRADMSHFGVSKSQQGKEYSEGGLNFAMQPDMFMGLHFYGIYGGEPSVSTGTHTFTEVTNKDLPSFTMEIGREEKEHTYTGMMCNRLSISANLNEYVMVSSDWVGKSESAVSTLVTPKFCGAGIDAMHFRQCSVKFLEDAQASTLVKSINIDWTNNLDTDNACALGSTTYVRAPTPQRREITGSVEFAKVIHTAVESEPTYTQMITAAGLEFNPDAAADDYAIQLLITDGVSPTTIDLYKVRWEAASSTVSGRDTQTMSMNFTALYDSDGSNPANAMSKTVFNDHANGTIQMHKL